MARVCACRVCYLFLTAALFLLVFSLAGGDIHAGSSPRDGTNEPSRERVQRLLSDQRIDDSEAITLIFKEDEIALPLLLTALRERKNVERASWALASLGGPKEREVLRTVIVAEKDQEKKWLMSSFLAGALVEPASDEEWHFLETCLRGYKNEDRAFASFSAALALGVNASPHALQILEAIVTPGQSPSPDNDTFQEVTQAIQWIKHRSSLGKGAARAQSESDSEQIKHVVLGNAFYAEGERGHFSVEDIVFTSQKGRALVSVEVYRGPKDAHGYNIVLERRSGAWKIVGVWASWAA
jgi:hypothetical protein